MGKDITGNEVGAYITFLILFVLVLVGLEFGVIERPLEGGRSYKMPDGQTQKPVVDDREVVLLEKSFDTRFEMITLLLSSCILMIGGMSVLVFSKASVYFVTYRPPRIFLIFSVLSLCISVYAGYYGYHSLVILADAAVHDPENNGVAIPGLVQIVFMLLGICLFGCLLVHKVGTKE